MRKTLPITETIVLYGERDSLFLVDILLVTENNREMTDLFSLDKSYCFEQLIHGSKATWKDDKCLGIFDKHCFAHEEVTKIQRDIEIGIWSLLKR